MIDKDYESNVFSQFIIMTLKCCSLTERLTLYFQI